MAAAKGRGLGKGLEALFHDLEIDVTTAAGSHGSEAVRMVGINEIRPNANQPRTHFDEEAIRDLSHSIETHGVLQPILVRPSVNGYEIVAGERRWRAARLAGLRDVPCLVRDFSDEENMLIALIENIQREDLNPVEEAKGMRRMAESYGLTQEEIAKSLGKSRPYVANALRLLKLPSDVITLLEEGALSGGHGRAIAGIEGPSRQSEAARRCVAEGWNVRQIEHYAGTLTGSRGADGKKLPKRREKNREVAALEEDLKTVLGTRVNLVLGARRGRIEIEYYSREELERLIELLKRLK